MAASDTQKRQPARSSSAAGARPQAPAQTQAPATSGTTRQEPATPAAPATTAAASAAPAATATQQKPVAEHEPDFVLDPSVRKFDLTKVPEGKVVYLVKCQGCPWHAANPNVWRVLVTKGEVPALELGQTVTLTHHIKKGWWGDWKVEAIYTGTPGDAETKVEGKNNSGKVKGGHWTIMPVPAVVAAAATTAAEGGSQQADAA